MVTVSIQKQETGVTSQSAADCCKATLTAITYWLCTLTMVTSGLLEQNTFIKCREERRIFHYMCPNKPLVATQTLRIADPKLKEKITNGQLGH